MSDFLVHLTDDRSTLKKILQAGCLEASGPLGAVRKHPEISTLPSQESCSLSEIPLDYLDRLTAQHGRYGLGFRKSFVRKSGGARVWYLDKGVEVQTLLFNHFKDEWRDTPDPKSVLWQITPFIDYVMPSHEFEWEREWRVIDGLKFDSKDVAFVFAPEKKHSKLGHQLSLDDVPLIDTTWEDARLQSAIAKLFGT